MEPEAANSIRTFDARLHESDLSRRRALFHLNPDMVVVGLDHHPHDLSIPEPGVANGVVGDLAERQAYVVVTVTQ